MNRLLNCVRIWRPPSTTVSTDLPVSTIGGVEGSIHIVCFVSQVPAKCSASCACCGPGVAAFCQAALIACCSASGVAAACGAGCRAGSPCAAAAAANGTKVQADAACRMRSRCFILSEERHLRQDWVRHRVYQGLSDHYIKTNPRSPDNQI